MIVANMMVDLDFFLLLRKGERTKSMNFLQIPSIIRYQSQTQLFFILIGNSHHHIELFLCCKRSK